MNLDCQGGAAAYFGRLLGGGICIAQKREQQRNRERVRCISTPEPRCTSPGILNSKSRWDSVVFVPCRQRSLPALILSYPTSTGRSTSSRKPSAFTLASASHRIVDCASATRVVGLSLGPNTSTLLLLYMAYGVVVLGFSFCAQQRKKQTKKQQQQQHEKFKVFHATESRKQTGSGVMRSEESPRCLIIPSYLHARDIYSCMADILPLCAFYLFEFVVVSFRFVFRSLGSAIDHPPYRVRGTA